MLFWFLVFGFASYESTSKKSIPIVPNQMNALTTRNIKPIVIDKTKKVDILNQLKKLGISHATLFPEIDHVATELKKSFMK